MDLAEVHNKMQVNRVLKSPLLWTSHSEMFSPFSCVDTNGAIARMEQ